MDFENELKEMLEKQDNLLAQINLLTNTVEELKAYLSRLGERDAK